MYIRDVFTYNAINIKIQKPHTTKTIASIMSPQTPDEVSEWLNSLGLERYQENFNNAGIDTFKLLTMVKKSDLEKIGVKLSFHRDLLLRKIKEIQTSRCEYKIVLRTIDGKMITFTLDPNIKINQLKSKVEKDWLGLAVSNQHLVVAGKELTTGTLKSAGIVSGTIIFVIPVSTPTTKKEHSFESSVDLKQLEIPIKLHLTRTAEEFDLMVNGNNTVLFIHQLAAKFVDPTPQQILIHNAHILDDDSTSLSECGVRAGDKIYLVSS